MRFSKSILNMSKHEQKAVMHPDDLTACFNISFTTVNFGVLKYFKTVFRVEINRNETNKDFKLNEIEQHKVSGSTC